MHVKEISRRRTQLRAVGVEIDDVMYTVDILSSLSSKFENLTLTLEAHRNSLTIEDLQARIYHEEACHGVSDGNDGKALAVQSGRP